MTNEKICIDKRIGIITLLAFPLILLATFSGIVNSRKLSQNSKAYEAPTPILRATATTTPFPPTPVYSGPSVRAMCLQPEFSPDKTKVVISFVPEIKPLETSDLEIYSLSPKEAKYITTIKKPFTGYTGKPLYTVNSLMLEKNVEYMFLGFQGKIASPSGAPRQDRLPDSPKDEILNFVLKSASRDCLGITK